MARFALLLPREEMVEPAGRKAPGVGIDFVVQPARPPPRDV